MNDGDGVKKLRTGFERRWRRLLEASKERGIPPPDKEKLWKKVLDRYVAGFTCAYCGKPMKIGGDIYPFLDTWSIDHKRSLWAGGDNSLENLEIVCVACNLGKGTADSETWAELARRTPHELLDRYTRGAAAGWISERIRRWRG